MSLIKTLRLIRKGGVFLKDYGSDILLQKLESYRKYFICSRKFKLVKFHICGHKVNRLLLRVNKNL